MKIQIAVAATRFGPMPEEEMYLPMQAGAKEKPSIGFARDDEGVNISEQNPYYSELTVLYWLWKNADADVCGLMHYRRLFADPHAHALRRHPYEKVLRQKNLEEMLQKTDIILPKARRYVIETLSSHYAHSHDGAHLSAARSAIERLCPAYLDAFDQVMQRRSGHMFNMMIMKRERFDAYCAWLFPLLSDVKEQIGGSGYDDFEKRFVGRVAELLLDVFITCGGYDYRELSVITVGTVHWVKKAASFLAARLFHRRYRKSF